MDIILDVQGFRQSGNELVPKELGAITIQPDEEGKQGLTRILFKPPCVLETIPARYRATNAWLTRNYHGIPWNVGDMPYDDVQKVLKRIVEHASYIFVKGLEKKQWVERIIGGSKPVIDLENLGCPKIRELQLIKVAHWHDDCHGDVPGYLCAFENVQRMKMWYLEKCSGSFEKSINLFLQLKGLEQMKAEDIAFLPKDFILLFASNDIDYVWEKLSDNMKNDDDIAGCRRCRKHYRNGGRDEFDGPIPMVKDCSECQLNR